MSLENYFNSVLKYWCTLHMFTTYNLCNERYTRVYPRYHSNTVVCRTNEICGHSKHRTQNQNQKISMAAKRCVTTRSAFGRSL